ncbi:AAA family ATPase [Thermoflexibacter ruber]|uniref:ATPase family associated with various cellular activities (AAA) n=1 Tax=Thermoflexibacter ruber TaxID=1003 RepID=A0A1I2JDX6_9BACT|nr:AAA family ATPase [Thermoflexibacter ruber]SFF50871.1 ATPase family associated with various cellular activities (AAA) [Thermoflexibacter ruber]
MKNHILKKIHPNVAVQYHLQDIIDYNSQLNPGQLFISTNEFLPNILSFAEDIDGEKLLATLKETYQLSHEQIWTYRRYSKEEDKRHLRSFLVTIHPNLLVYFGYDDNADTTKVLYDDRVNEEDLQKITRVIKDCSEIPKAESKIFLLYESHGYLALRDFEVRKSNIDLAMNYNDDFLPIHEVILKRLQTQDDKGLVLLHGLPGTGKTSYIRYLTSLINKKMIYIPPEFAPKIASPDFLPLLISNSNSILIIEDAENIIEDRGSSRSAAISNLLNITDGLLSDCLNIQILCTFNTHITRIDKALMRKGRLIAIYEFKELQKDKAKKLADSLGYNSEIEKDTLLTEIYNQNEVHIQPITNSRKKIGFTS